MSYDYFVFIPAGKPFYINGTLKHHLPFGNKSILENIIDSANNVGLKVVTTVRESDSLREKYEGNKDVVILEAKEKVVDSCLYGLIEGIINNFYADKFRGSWNSVREVKKHFTKHTEIENARVIYLGSDMPFFNEKDIAKFISEYEKNNSDLFVGMTDMDKLSRMNKELNLEIEKIDSTINNYCVTDKGNLRVSNMYMMNPAQIVNKGLLGVIQMIYDFREISKREKKTMNMTSALGQISGLLQVLSRGVSHPFHAKGLYANACMLGSHVRGINHNQIVDSTDALMHAEPILGVNVGIDTTCDVRPLLDVDDEGSYKLFLENKDKILEYCNRVQ